MFTDLFHSSPIPLSAEGRCAGSGVIVLTSSMRVLHVNQQAVEVAKYLPQEESEVANQNPWRGLFPRTVAEFGAELVRALKKCMEGKDKKQFEVTRLAGDGRRSVRLRGFVLPDARGIEQSRLVITLEEIGSRL